MSPTTRILFLFLLILASPMGTPASAQLTQDNAMEGVESRRISIERIEMALATDSQLDLLGAREELRRIRSAALAAARPLRNLTDQTQADLDRLGPAPAEGSPEAADIAQARARLQNEFQRANDSLRQGELNISKTTRLLEEIAKRRRDAFYANIFERRASPLLPSVWQPAWRNVNNLRASGLTAQDNAGASSLTLRWGRLLGLGLAVLVAGLLFGPVRKWTDRQIVARLQSLGPTQSSRTAVAGARTLGRMLPGMIGGYLILETARALGFIKPEFDPFAMAVLFSLLGLFVADGLVTAVFSPKTREWRLIPIHSGAAISLRILVWLTAGLLAFDALFQTGSELISVTGELAQVHASLIAIVGAALLYLICRRKNWQLQEGFTDFAPAIRGNANTLRTFGQAVAVVIFIAVLLGYSAFGRFVITRIFLIVGLLGAAWFVRALMQEAVNHYRHKAVRRAQTDDAIEESGERLIFFWIGIVLDIFLLVAVMPLITALLGMEWAEVRDMMSDAFFGFRLGPVTISISQILLAIFTFSAILFVTRFIQRGADTRVFSQAKLDEGIRNSFRTLNGYVGLVIAALAGITMLGLDLASFAIIAGALSLGIGFGLQSIVNNFVSGLILLFERPIKVGDWIVVGSGEGVVKRISVRSTEIETFDRASIIVPNSELISSSVQNWTHKDKFTRLIMPIGAAYKEDPKIVMAILQTALDENQRIVRWPLPMVYFSGFGDNSIDFELRFFIRTPDDRIPVQNELRIKVFEAFRDADIEIPFPQRDLHVRSWPDETQTPELPDAEPSGTS